MASCAATKLIWTLHMPSVQCIKEAYHFQSGHYHAGQFQWFGLCHEVEAEKKEHVPKSECDPCGYVPMTDSAHVSSLIKYKWHKSKSTSQLVVREKDRMPLRKASLYRYRSLMQVCTEVEATEVVISPSEKTPALVPRRLEFTDSPECSSAD
ncbi:unnamed protein product [Heligmosomoides polygyrus]|uniref:CACTA en-spm transposon protein n=1 Tax=Heligmosomoides polygyrus TaxID=6339 RepID=A0A3P8CR69_HELPZ|nr:unnamed protein product [Heligmosomoides polygyrus]